MKKFEATLFENENNQTDVAFVRKINWKNAENIFVSEYCQEL